MSFDTSHFQQVKSHIIKVVATLSDNDSIEVDQPLYELGIDSLATVSLLVEISAAAGVDLEDFVDEIEPPKTVADLCEVARIFEGNKVCN